MALSAVASKTKYAAFRPVQGRKKLEMIKDETKEIARFGPDSIGRFPHKLTGESVTAVHVLFAAIDGLI